MQQVELEPEKDMAAKNTPKVVVKTIAPKLLTVEEMSQLKN